MGRAIGDYGMAIALDPEYFAAYYNRGFAHRKKGALREARRDFEMALKIDPSDEKAKSILRDLGGS